MLKDLFIVWIVAQLIVISWADTSLINEIISQSFDCQEWQEELKEPISHVIDVVAPLSTFVPKNSLISNYCNSRQ